AFGFLMLPFYTHYLKPADYGILEILDLTMSLAGMCLNMGIGAAMMRYYGAAKSAADRHKVVSTSFIFVALASLATFSAAFSLAGSATRALFGPGIPSSY